ncbi:DUF445 family protein [Corynebacterium lizhenjunii]|uniref:DUF445 family protein n=1 Tax=Corynebacterium lizhenjunii TaxID=2709394 RepID=A0A7T0PC72_9CORY|nr:DUF445 family protein [Corynebacterium lizhenjunii]QPK79382.1 DUF445 family protein [Corynebacterium lizhenjunii]
MSHRASQPADTPHPSPTPSVVPAPAPHRAQELRRWKTIALSFLLGAAVIFLACSWWQSQGAPAWVGYVRAAAEAGMVGGLADWFAVTALFRHPLGLPIPHTALIPRNKDRVGEALSEFVEENFLTPDALSEKVTQAQLPTKAARWLVQPEHAQRASAEIGTRVAGVIADFDREEAAAIIQTHIIDRATAPEWGPPAGRLLEAYIAEGKARPLEDDLIAWAAGKVDDWEGAIVRTIDERMPGWAPRFARELVGEKVYEQVRAFAQEVQADGNHEARLSLRRMLSDVAAGLQHDPALRAKVEDIKAQMLSSAQMQRAPGAIWETVSTALREQLEDPDSQLRTKLADKCQEVAQQVLSDAPTLARANQLVDQAARYAVEKFAPDLISIIPETIKRWDASEASANIELMVGKDLQFIRLNGTVVGALAGVVIYTVNQLLFG